MLSLFIEKGQSTELLTLRLSCNFKDKIIAKSNTTRTVVTRYKFWQIIKMAKSLQASVGEIDPALFFIALIVAFIFALYQSWSSDKPDNKGGLVSEGVLNFVLSSKNVRNHFSFNFSIFI